VPNTVHTYALHDSDPNCKTGAVRINRAHAHEWNKRGYGIYHTVNFFKGRRKKANLVCINSWFTEIDAGTKTDMRKIIERGPVPTMIAETKRSYHVYFKAKDGTPENWDAIMKHRLIPFYNGDPKAADITRLLRVPGFYHTKDPTAPFLVKKVWEEKVEYSERDMFHMFPDLDRHKRDMREIKKTITTRPEGDDFWSRIWSMNCEEALTRLSGSDHVSGEAYSFKQNGSGTKNIIVNGKGTSCWIDLDGKIGSYDGGGPGIYNWLNWYHKNHDKVVGIIKEVFPECAQTQMTLFS